MNVSNGPTHYDAQDSTRSGAAVAGSWRCNPGGKISYGVPSKKKAAPPSTSKQASMSLFEQKVALVGFLLP